MTSLPLIDEHARRIDADPEAVWAGLGRMLGRSPRPLATVAARLLGARPARSAGDPLHVGATLPGFEVVRADRPRELVLAGRHRFSRYALTFRLQADDRATVVRAESRGEFPGAAGRLYRAAVIGTRGHVLAVRGMLATVAARTPRST